MKILSIVNCEKKPWLGAAYQPLLQVSEFARMGIAVKLLGTEDYLPSAILRFPRLSNRLNSIYYLIGAFKNLSSDLDVIELWGSPSWLAILILKLVFSISFRKGRRPLLIHRSNGIESNRQHTLKRITGSGDIHQRTGIFRSIVERYRWKPFHLALSICDGAVTGGMDDLDYLVKQRILPKEQLAAIPPPLVDRYLGLKPNISARKNQVCFNGTWMLRKGISAIIGAIPIFLRNNPDYRFLILGAARDFQKARYFPEELLSRVDCLPFNENRDELISTLKDSKVFYFPTLYEGFGMTTSEAMACGCATVTTRTGFGASLKHGINAWIVPADDPTTQAEALTELCRNESLRCKIAENGYQTVQALTIEAYCKSLLEFYRGLGAMGTRNASIEINSLG